MRKIYFFLFLLAFGIKGVLAETEPNNSYTQANILTIGIPMSGELGLSGDTEDWYQISITKQGSLLINATCNGSLTVNQMSIYYNNGSTVVATGDYGANASVSSPNLQPGIYYVRVPIWQNSGSYTLNATFTESTYPTDVENNDLLQDAVFLPLNDSLNGTLGYASLTGVDNVDWYKFNVPSDGKVEFTVNCISPLTVDQLRIYDQIPNQAAQIGTGNYGATAGVSVPNLTPGTYYLYIPRWQNYGSYKIIYKFTPADLPIDTLNNDSLPVAQFLPLNDSTTGHLGYYGANKTDITDWYKFDVPSDGKVEFTVNCVSPLTVDQLRIYDQIPNQAAQIGTGNYGATAGVSIPNLTPGRYYLYIPRWQNYGSYKVVYKFTPSIYINDSLYNDSIQYATELNVNDSSSGHLYYYGSGKTDVVDYWKIKADKKGTMYVRIKTDSFLTIDNMWLYDQNYNPIANGGYGSNQLASCQVMPNQTYYVIAPRWQNYGGYKIYDTIKPAPEVNFSYIQNLYFCNFTDSSLYASSYKWDFGDGTTSTFVNPSHTYTTPGVFDVTLVAFNPAGSDTLVKQVTIKGIQNIVSNKAGNSGYASFYIYGGGLTANSKVRLTRTGYTDIVADTVVKPSLGSIKPKFNFTGVDTGAWNVVVEIPGDTIMIVIDGFTIENGRPADFWVNVTGREKILFNRWQTYNINYGNSGNIDANAAPFWFVISDIPGLEVQFLSKQIGLPSETDSLWQAIKDSVPAFFTIDSINGEAFKARVYPLFLANVPANFSGSITIRIKSPADFRTLTWVNDNYFNGNKISDYDKCIMWAQATALANGLVNLVASQIPGAQCVSSISQTLYGLGFNDNTMSSALWSLTRSAITCVWDLGSEIPIIKAWEISNKIFELAADIYDNYGAVQECKEKFKKKKPDDDKVKAVNSFDPNEIVGPNGFKEEKYARKDVGYDYRIYFENKADAGPALEVFVFDTLDLTKYDISKFSLGPINFGDTTIYPLTGLTEFTTDVDLRPSKNIIVRLNAKLDTTTGIISWSYTSLDPATMALTEEGDGFLPPNVNSPEGEGYVSFSCGLKQNLANGTQISNKAAIVFDLNPQILTNTWINTIDINKPSSSIQPLNNVINDTTFTLNWTGNDNESGVMNYAILYKEDNGVVKTWKSNIRQTTTVFTGQYGKTYSFYCVATDSTGNVEDTTSVPDATTTLEVNSIDNINAFAYASIYPNPVQNELFVEFNLTSTQAVSIELIDVFGKKIKNINYGNMIGGKHQLSIDIKNLASGFYTLNLSSKANSSKFKIVKN
ncbi:MAG: T9SS type A sorting domain-containing protein [Bacteroidota bacterium]